MAVSRSFAGRSVVEWGGGVTGPSLSSFGGAGRLSILRSVGRSLGGAAGRRLFGWSFCWSLDRLVGRWVVGRSLVAVGGSVVWSGGGSSVVYRSVGCSFGLSFVWCILRSVCRSFGGTEGRRSFVRWVCRLLGSIVWRGLLFGRSVGR